MTSEPAEPTEAVREIHETDCVVVGAGPAGAVLALLLARKGVKVTLLESHGDFDREFRGDTLHPSTLELMDQLGLADRLLQLPHTREDHVSIITPEGKFPMADLRRLRTKFPYIAVMAQARFLEFVTAEAARYPTFTLRMRATAQRLVEQDGRVVGVRYQAADGWYEVRAALTVACDGRHSRLRKLAGLEPVQSGAPMDVLWFRLPVRPGDVDQLTFRIRGGHMLVLIPRGDYWQAGFIILKGTFREVKQEGLEHFRTALAQLAPEFADRLDALPSLNELTPLVVESSRLPRWHKPGLLLIGDAAHVMSPVGGVGINYAIQDAVEAANVLIEPLKAGTVREEHLAAVQRRREFPTKFIQWFQNLVQQRIVKAALRPDRPFRLPFIFRLPGVTSLVGSLIAFGIRRVRLKE